MISPKVRIEIDLEQLRNLLSERGFPIKVSGMLGITFEQSDDIMISILKSGIMILQTSPTLESELKDDIFETYKSILVDGLGLSQAILSEA